MKTNKILFSTTAVALLVAIASITLYSCKKKPFDDIDVIVNSNFTTAAIGVVFEDAKTGEPVGWNDESIEVEIEIIGEDASKIVTIMNNSDFKVGRGFLSLALAEGITATNDNPVKFTITAKADGFVPNSFPITVRNEGGINISIPMVSISDAPEGVAVKIDNTSLDATETSNPTGTTTTISINSGAATSGSDATTATIDIPAGQMFYTSDGTKITEALEITFAKFSASEPASLRSFPGTLNANLSNGTNGRFITAGLISLEMKTSSGKEVTSFEKPITVTTGIPSGITNFDGTEIIAGDTIPVWSHNKETGFWTYEGNCTVVDNGGVLETTYTITHLSFWNIDKISKESDHCYPGGKINFTGNVTSSQMYYAALYDENGKWWSAALGGLKVKSGTTESMQAGLSRNMYIMVFKSQSDILAGWEKPASEFESKAIGKSDIFNACSGTGTCDVQDPNPTYFVTVNATCGGNTKTYRPTFPVFAADKTAGEFFPKALGQVVNGKFESTDLVEGHTYTVWVYYNSEFKTQDVTIDSQEVTVNLALSQAACNTLNIQ